MKKIALLSIIIILCASLAVSQDMVPIDYGGSDSDHGRLVEGEGNTPIDGPDDPGGNSDTSSSSGSTSSGSETGSTDHGFYDPLGYTIQKATAKCFKTGKGYHYDKYNAWPPKSPIGDYKAPITAYLTKNGNDFFVGYDSGLYDEETGIYSYPEFEWKYVNYNDFIGTPTYNTQQGIYNEGLVSRNENKGYECIWTCDEGEDYVVDNIEDPKECIKKEENDCLDEDGDYYVRGSDYLSCGNVCGPDINRYNQNEPCKGGDDCDDYQYDDRIICWTEPNLEEKNWVIETYRVSTEDFQSYMEAADEDGLCKKAVHNLINQRGDFSKIKYVEGNQGNGYYSSVTCTFPEDTVNVLDGEVLARNNYNYGLLYDYIDCEDNKFSVCAKCSGSAVDGCEISPCKDKDYDDYDTCDPDEEGDTDGKLADCNDDQSNDPENCPTKKEGCTKRNIDCAICTNPDSPFFKVESIDVELDPDYITETQTRRKFTPSFPITVFDNINVKVNINNFPNCNALSGKLEFSGIMQGYTDDGYEEEINNWVFEFENADLANYKDYYIKKLQGWDYSSGNIGEPTESGITSSPDKVDTFSTLDYFKILLEEPYPRESRDYPIESCMFLVAGDPANSPIEIVTMGAQSLKKDHISHWAVERAESNMDYMNGVDPFKTDYDYFTHSVDLKSIGDDELDSPIKSGADIPEESSCSGARIYNFYKSKSSNVKTPEQIEAAFTTIGSRFIVYDEDMISNKINDMNWLFDFGFSFVHELGHALGYLDDQYPQAPVDDNLRTNCFYSLDLDFLPYGFPHYGCSQGYGITPTDDGFMWGGLAHTAKFGDWEAAFLLNEIHFNAPPPNHDLYTIRSYADYSYNSLDTIHAYTTDAYIDCITGSDCQLKEKCERKPNAWNNWCVPADVECTTELDCPNPKNIGKNPDWKKNCRRNIYFPEDNRCEYGVCFVSLLESRGCTDFPSNEHKSKCIDAGDSGVVKITNLKDNNEIVKERDFWFAWYAFHPETLVYEN